jgi:hypothetical protein
MKIVKIIGIITLAVWLIVSIAVWAWLLQVPPELFAFIGGVLGVPIGLVAFLVIIDVIEG